VIHDPTLGRLVLRGPIGFGSYQVLEKALAMQPHLPLIQVESPGGYVIEGMAMARLISEHHLDTVSLENCASACTFLLAAGEDRFVAANAKVGFHHSWSYGATPTTVWGPTEHLVAKLFQTHGVTEDFIQHALSTPPDDLWIPDAQELIVARFATRLWSERPAGY
jgi:hypothetical protein